ncbi:hypothetical protein EGT29_24650 [Pigmentiphaga sp. H8]|uniref:hypothetical protein n=1 Tax=Pigmentiphaga sp. H8 TaxID=2488560 RepID=UPI000F59890F|nr:hypothetical protein [Pigmentiphaga sp. H8]AZG10819.1 hypothetical protein EGT29_24650 [Pigmentiphaga sp. H8]
MNYLYFHDEARQTVYRMLSEPRCHAQIHGRGKAQRTTGWYFSTEIEITRADNRLSNGRWVHDVRITPYQIFDVPRYSETEARGYFVRNQTPDGVQISPDEYEELRQKYEKTARNAKAT